MPRVFCKSYGKVEMTNEDVRPYSSAKTEKMKQFRSFEALSKSSYYTYLPMTSRAFATLAATQSVFGEDRARRAV